MDIEQALACFADYPKVVRALQPLIAVGLGYLQLGQPLNTLSGGESQRLKLVSYLGKVADQSGHALILIDEPTTGLHRADVKRLIGVLQALVDAGHSLIVIEHNLDMLKVADWIVELGPGAGARGGQLVAQGTPEAIAQSSCQTAPYLQQALQDQPAPAQSLHVAESEAIGRSTADRASTAPPAQLSIRGARDHNLQNICTEIPQPNDRGHRRLRIRKVLAPLLTLSSRGPAPLHGIHVGLCPPIRRTTTARRGR